MTSIMGLGCHAGERVTAHGHTQDALSTTTFQLNRSPKIAISFVGVRILLYESFLLHFMDWFRCEEQYLFRARSY